MNYIQNILFLTHLYLGTNRGYIQTTAKSDLEKLLVAQLLIRASSLIIENEDLEYRLMSFTGGVSVPVSDSGFIDFSGFDDNEFDHNFPDEYLN